jgi:lipopolysaccharide export system permease protein
MKLIDRVLLRAYLKAYLVCLVSLVSLYIIVDLFTNVEEFTDRHHGLLPVLKHIGTYYAYKLAYIFDKLCEAIVLLAAMFTVAWMQRNNELLPLLSAGVSTRRVIRPVLVGACLMLSLSMVNQELIIPRIGNFLVNDRDDPLGEKDVLVLGAFFEPNGIHIEGKVANRRDLLVQGFNVDIPENIAGGLFTLSAEKAYYYPPGKSPRGTGWLLTRTTPPELEHWNNPVLEMIEPGKYFLHTTQLDFDALTRRQNWYVYASTTQLLRELSRPDTIRLTPMAVLFHMRLTRPILGILLVFLGLSVILRDQNRNVFLSAGLCLVLCGVFFGACFVCRHLGDNEYVSPALAAWMPVLFFGPLSVAMFDAIHT